MRLFLFPLFILLSAPLWSQQLIFNENFNNGIPSTWYLVNSDNLTPAAAVDTFDNAWISFVNDGDTCAASTSFYEPAGQAADYLITPRISIDAFSKLVWSAKSYDGSYPDGYLVLISATDSLITSFTDTLLIEDAQIPYWQTRSVQLDTEGYASEDIFIAFKNISADGYILMIDDVKVLSSDNAAISSNEYNALQVYPNPFSNFVHISGMTENTTVSFYTMNGELLLQSNDSDVDLTPLPSGLYTCRIVAENNVQNLILVKQ